MRFISVLLFIFVIAVLTSCTFGRWVQSGMTTQELARDRYECNMQTTFPRQPPMFVAPQLPNQGPVMGFAQGFAAGTEISRELARPSPRAMYELCMEGRGWTWVRD
jgi:hypothetical protein